MANKTYGIFVKTNQTKSKKKRTTYKQFWFNGNNKSWNLKKIKKAIKPIIEIMDETDVIKVTIFEGKNLMDEIMITLEDYYKHWLKNK